MLEKVTEQYLKSNLPILAKKSFGDIIQMLEGQQEISKYDLFEWYFDIDGITELGNSNLKLLGRKNRKYSVQEALLEHIIPTIIFEETMVERQFHFALHRLQQQSPARYAIIMAELREFEGYVFHLRNYQEQMLREIEKAKQSIEYSRNELVVNDDEQVIKRIHEMDAQLKTLENMEDIVNCQAFFSEKSWKKCRKDLKDAPIPEALWKLLTPLSTFEQKFAHIPFVRQLIASSIDGIWFSYMAGMQRDRDIKKVESFTEVEVEWIKKLRQSFDEYEQFHAIFVNRERVKLSNLLEFVLYFQHEPNLYEFIATKFNAKQRAEAFGILVQSNVQEWVPKLLKDDRSISYFEQILEQAIIFNNRDALTQFCSILNKKIDWEFVSKHIIDNRSITWLALLQPKDLVRTISARDQQQIFDHSMAAVMEMLAYEWLWASEFSKESYLQYWLYFFTHSSDFRAQISTDSTYLIRYRQCDGNSEKVWQWFTQLAKENELTELVAEPKEGMELILPLLFSEEETIQLALKWLKVPAYHTKLEQMGYELICSEDHENKIIQASQVLKCSNHFELEDGNFFGDFENYTFTIKEIGLKGKNGEVLRRALIQSEFKGDGVALDDLLDELSNL